VKLKHEEEDESKVYRAEPFLSIWQSLCGLKSPQIYETKRLSSHKSANFTDRRNINLRSFLSRSTLTLFPPPYLDLSGKHMLSPILATSHVSLFPVNLIIIIINVEKGKLLQFISIFLCICNNIFKKGISFALTEKLPYSYSKCHCHKHYFWVCNGQCCWLPH
jgi:hypothetical protein